MLNNSKYKIGQLVHVNGRDAKIINFKTSYIVAFDNGLTDHVIEDEIEDAWKIILKKEIIKYMIDTGENDFFIDGTTWLESNNPEYVDYKFKIRNLDANNYKILKIKKDYCSWDIISIDDLYKYRISAGEKGELMDGQTWLKSDNPEYVDFLFKIAIDKDKNYRFKKVNPDRLGIESRHCNSINSIYN